MEKNKNPNQNDAIFLKQNFSLPMFYLINIDIPVAGRR